MLLRGRCVVEREDDADWRTAVLREAAEAVVWMADDQLADLVRMLVANDEVGASRMLGALVPDLESLEFPAWREALLAELQFRVDAWSDASLDRAPRTDGDDG